MSSPANLLGSSKTQLAPIEALYRKITWRFIPLLFICYVINYMDRTNIGFAQLQIKGDLGFSDLAYGIGAGMFFVSYSAFAFPSNLLMTRIGARKTIFLSLVGWGLTSAGTMFVRTPVEFYGIRFLLGVVEAGFFPGIVYYFGQWYPSDRRGNILGIFTSATVVAGIVSGVVSGAIIAYLDNHWGLRGWQWMFVLEGLPAAFLGIVVWFFLDDEPKFAKWLSPSEKKVIVEALEEDKKNTPHHTLKGALKEWRVYLLGLIYFLSVFGAFVLAFWQPSMIKEFGVSSVMIIGLYSTIPAIAAVGAKVFVGYHSDKKKELRWHYAVPAFLGSAGFLLATVFPHNPLWGVACLALATAGVHGCMPIIWAAPGMYLTGTAAAGGIAIISTIGTLSGAVGPSILGALRGASGDFTSGMYLLTALLTLSAFLMLGFIPKRKPVVESEIAEGQLSHRH